MNVDELLSQYKTGALDFRNTNLSAKNLYGLDLIGVTYKVQTCMVQPWHSHT